MLPRGQNCRARKDSGIEVRKKSIVSIYYLIERFSNIEVNVLNANKISSIRANKPPDIVGIEIAKRKILPTGVETEPYQIFYLACNNHGFEGNFQGRKMSD